MHKPLSGIRILDLSQAWAGPFASMLLADIGAEVIKIEPPVTGDHVRNWVTKETNGHSPHLLAVNRNKKSLILDLKNETGKQLFFEMAEKSDVILENFRPGIMKKLGIDYDEVRKRNPEIIFCSVSGFGQTGPYKDIAAYDLIIQGEGGAMSVTGERGGRPLKPGVPQADVFGAMVASNCIMAAIMTKQQTGKGSYLDIAMMDTQIALMGYYLANYVISGKIGKPMGTAHSLMVPYQSFPAKDIDINIAVLNDRAWKHFCEVIGKLEWIDDPRFITGENRVENRDFLVPLIEEITMTREANYWIQKFSEKGIPVGAINPTDRLFSHPQVAHRNMLRKVQHPEIGEIVLPGIPWKLPGIDDEEILAPPLHGQHTTEVLKKVLNLSEEQIKKLEDEQVITPAARGKTPVAKEK
ncbi:CoA transferase [Bacillus sp. 1P10SD]|uniref:CaiB/BaiF CoA transferase family protein n=1 Tax=Bacillus sp. 1P10SD TaxID=3132265 RepID=UPI0039A6F3AC